MSASWPLVAVVGRPNVGKSTLFNRILGRRKAIVDDRPGVTRDRNFEPATWNGRDFMLVDTGGIVEADNEPMDSLVRDQAMSAIGEADLILLVVDTKVGVHPLDERLADLLRSRDRDVIVVANKSDQWPPGADHNDFWGLALGDPYPVSAISGAGTGDLLDEIVDRLPPEDAPDGAESEIRIAVIGKPNAGKSSFVNRLFGEERSVVSSVPGTTRDPIDSVLKYHGRDLRFVDTAGLRRQSRIKDSLEFYSRIRTERVVRDADVCVLLIDATEGITHQDLRIAEEAWDAGAGLILVVNKWDLVEKETMTAPDFQNTARAKAPFLKWVPFLYSSALTGLRVRKALDLILEVQSERLKRVPTADVNSVVERMVGRQPPPHHRGRPVRLKYATQADVAPPTFIVFSNYPKAVPDHYIRYMHNTFRDAWSFMGAPLRIRLRSGDPS